MTEYWKLYRLPAYSGESETHIGTYYTKRKAVKQKRKRAAAADLLSSDYEVRRVEYE